MNNINKPTNMRTFFAIMLPKAVQEEIMRLITSLKKVEPAYCYRSFAKQKKLHITLKFIGDITQETCSAIIKEVKPLLSDIPAFDMHFTELLPFPNQHAPIAVTLKPEPIVDLTVLALALETCVTQLGVRPEKKAFKPHLTLVKTCAKPFLGNKRADFSQFVLPKITFRVDTVQLLQSKPGPTGSIFLPLASFSLRK